MRRAEVRVAGELHDLELAKPLGQPIADGCASEVVERAVLDTRTPENRPENLIELRDELLP